MKKGLKIGIIVVLSIIMFGVGYYTEVYRIKNANSKEKETEEVASYEEVAPLVKAIENVYAKYAVSYEKGFDKIATDEIIYRSILEVGRDRDYKDIPATEVRKYVTKYFGENLKYEDHDIICLLDKNPIFVYKDGKYSIEVEKYTHGHGGSAGYENAGTPRIYIESVEKEKGTITINTRIAYARRCEDTCGPLNSYYKSNQGNTKEVYGDFSAYENIFLTDEELEKIKDQLYKTTFTFKQNSDESYYLSNIEVKD